MSGRNSQVSRIYSILIILEGCRNGLTTSQIWEELKSHGHDASKRTVYRDIQALQAAGFPLIADGEEGETTQRWNLLRTTTITQGFVLSARELLALFLAQGALSPLKTTPFYTDLIKVFKKIEEKLGAPHKDHLEELRGEIRFEPGPKWGLGIQPEVFETVHASCSERHILNAHYQGVSDTETHSRILGPHYLYFSKGSLYLVAEDLEDRRVKTFSVARFSQVEMTDQGYAGEVSDPNLLFSRSIGIYRGDVPERVRVQVLPPLAQYVRERSWHESQRVISRPKGAIELELEVAITPDLVQLILGFGPHARVLEPAHLAKQVLEKAEATVAAYRVA